MTHRLLALVLAGPAALVLAGAAPAPYEPGPDEPIPAEPGPYEPLPTEPEPGTAPSGEPLPPPEPPRDGGPGGDIVFYDSELVGALHAANQAEIALAQEVEVRATTAEVQAYAARMISDHSLLDEQLFAVADALGVRPAASPVSRKLAGMPEHVRAHLAPLSGLDYDRMYIDSQLVLHSGLLVLLDYLAGQPVSPEFLGMLDLVRPVILEHLEAATAIRRALPNP